MSYVMHNCKNKKCNNGWVDVDMTHAKTKPPKWKYCRECCLKLGIDFDNQVYKSNLSKEEKLKIKKRLLEGRKINQNLKGLIEKMP